MLLQMVHGEARVDEVFDDDHDTPLEGLAHGHDLLELACTLGPFVATIASEGYLKVLVDGIHELRGEHERAVHDAHEERITTLEVVFQTFSELLDSLADRLGIDIGDEGAPLEYYFSH